MHPGSHSCNARRYIKYTKKYIKIVLFYVLINTICIHFHILNFAGEDDLSSTGDKIGNVGKKIALWGDLGEGGDGLAP